MIASSRKENSALISGFRFIDRLTLRNIFKDNENKESGDFVSSQKLTCKNVKIYFLI